MTRSSTSTRRFSASTTLFRLLMPAAAIGVGLALSLGAPRAARADIPPPAPPQVASDPAAPAAPAEGSRGGVAKAAAPRIEVAILLDTSGSMDGLIDQARTRLWSIVNALAKAKKGGRAPDMRVALYEYGQTPVGSERGFIRRVQPLTDDLDAVSAGLFSLRTNGGEEFCGQAISTAVRELEWTAGDHYRAIFIAGNEPFTQGNVFYTEACAAALAKGVVVNTIHCGPEAQARDGMWIDGAKQGGGQCINIDQDATSAEVTTPYDERLRGLSESLNGTYVGYGRAGKEKAEAQRAQDSLAAGAAPSAAAERGVAKAGAGYRNSSWDIVDGVSEGKVDLEKAPAEDLPEEMRKMSLEEKKAYVAKKAEERKAVQAEIGKLAAERDAFLVEARKKNAAEGSTTFDSAMRGILEKQLQARGFSSDSPK